MGGGSSGDPPIGPTEESGSSGSSEDDTQQTGIDDHTSGGETEETQTPSGGVPTGGGSGGGGGGGTAPVAPPSGEETSPEEESPEPDDASDVEQQPDSDPDLPDEESDGEEDAEETEEDDKEDEDDEEEKEAQIIVHSDAWDDVGFGLYPIRYQLKEEYGDQIAISDAVLPIREFENPQDQAEEWEQNARRHEMPVDTSVWDSESPKSTVLSNRAFEAARDQGITLAKDYLRRLRIASVAEGRNIEDEETLLEMAHEVGLDSDQLNKDWEDVDVSESQRKVSTPKTMIHIDGETVTQAGYLHVDDLKMMFEQVGLEEECPQPLPDFVDEYGPVTVKEVQQVYDLDREQALAELQHNEDIESVEFGDATLWKSQ